MSTVSTSSDWTCPGSECRHVNAGRRSECSKCQRACSPVSVGGSSSHSKKKLGTEIGKAAAEKSRGLFSAEDWQCSKCANVNWARRQTCNMCNAPKFCDVEERTGYGGGYNDRGVVEYKERSESDSEYDEFGRLKKKRKRSKDNGRRDSREDYRDKPVAKPPVDVNEGDEDDDDEDDDNGDLSKYDLWGDEEPGANKTPKDSGGISDAVKNKSDAKPPKGERRSSRRSRSRTRSRSKKRSSSSSSSSTSSSSSSSGSSSSSSSSSPYSRSSSGSCSNSFRSRSRHRPRSTSKSRSTQRSTGPHRPDPVAAARTRSRERSKTNSQKSYGSRSPSLNSRRKRDAAESSRSSRRRTRSRSHSRSRSRRGHLSSSSASSKYGRKK